MIDREAIVVQNIDFFDIKESNIRKAFKVFCESVVNEINKVIECEANEVNGKNEINNIVEIVFLTKIEIKMNDSNVDAIIGFNFFA